jgi:low affinity Fe/Cu permease
MWEKIRSEDERNRRIGLEDKGMEEGEKKRKRRRERNVGRGEWEGIVDE